jgi:hypothetical protein
MRTLMIVIIIFMVLVSIGSLIVPVTLILAGTRGWSDVLVYLIPLAFGWTIIYVLWNAVNPRR